jgi:hypothetical protein
MTDLSVARLKVLRFYEVCVVCILSATNVEDFVLVSLSVSYTLWLRIKMHKVHCFTTRVKIITTEI